MIYHAFVALLFFKRVLSSPVFIRARNKNISPPFSAITTRGTENCVEPITKKLLTVHIPKAGYNECISQ